MSHVYLDHSATTPMDKEVLRVMKPYLEKVFGNASSLHSFGQVARQGVESARVNAARFLGCKTEEIIFTSGATESNNLAIFGLIKKLKKNNSGKKLHAITSSIEHPAVLEIFRELKKDGVDVTYLPITPKGLVTISELEKAIRPETALVSIMYVNNEVGTIQPIKEIGKTIKKINEKRPAEEKIYFHTDAVQAANFCECSVDCLGVDMLSLSSHKIYGPKGVGLLYVRNGTPLAPIICGGHQEGGKRSGTENVAGIVGFGAAISMLNKKEKIKKQNLKIKKLRDRLTDGILKAIPNAIFNGDMEKRVVSNVNFCFKNVEGESILLMLDSAGIAVSTGSACSSGSLEPSHVLLAMGVAPEVSHGSVRFTLGKENTAEDIDKVLKVLPPIIDRLRKMSPIK